MARALTESLSSDAVAYLRSEENVTVVVDPLRYVLALLIGGLLIVALTLLLAYDFRWGIAKTTIVVILLGIGSFCMVLAIAKLAIRRSRRIPTGLITTGEYIVFSDEHSVEWFPIADLISVDHRHSFKGRKYEHSTVSLTISGQSRKYRVDGVDEAEDIADKIEQAKKEALVRSTRTGSTETGSFFSEVPETAHRRPAFVSLAIDLGTLIVCSGLTVLGLLANEYFSDRLSWDQAVTINRASSYRRYLQGHAKGRWVSDATQRLKAFYDAAETKYKGVLEDAYDEAAVESILALLRYARDTHEYRIGISFERTADIPPDLIDRLKDEYKVKHVLPLGSAFSEEKMREREMQLFAYLQNTFAQIFPDDIVELVSECPDECARFRVRYDIFFQESIYYDLREKELPEADRKWSPGILIEWQFSLGIPGREEPYSFELDSAPAETIDYDLVDGSDANSESEANQNSFYDAMVVSSFDDFRAHLLFNLGLGPDPHPDDETPDVESSKTKV